VQKTGYIAEAGRCLVMQAVIDGRDVVIVLLDSWGKLTRIGDANRVRDWVESQYSVKAG
jgi:D-alanyl-D-alanine endopeptidase (penicillin-binding protein 7)